MTRPPVIECRSVDAGYVDPERGSVALVLKGVSFAVQRGERWLVLGRSGSGKSTLLRLLNRFDDPVAGDVLFHGRPTTEVDPLDLRRRVAVLPQAPVVFSGTVEENLTTAPPGIREPAPDVIASALSDVDLSPGLLGRRATELSIGEKQRVALARALLASPEVVLLDEPTSALDPRSTLRVAELIESLQEKRSLTVVVVTHEPSFARRVGGNTLLLRDGRADVGASQTEIDAFLDGAPP